MTKLEETNNRLLEYLPIDSTWYLAAEIPLKDIKAGEHINIVAECQIANQGLKKGNYAIFVSAKTTVVLDGKMVEVSKHQGDNIISRKDHYYPLTRVAWCSFDRDYKEIMCGLWLKSGSTQAIKGDRAHFKNLFQFQVMRFSED